MNDHVKRTGPAVEAHYQFLLWLVPTVDRFPKSQKFAFGDRVLNLALDASFSRWSGKRMGSDRRRRSIRRDQKSARGKQAFCCRCSRQKLALHVTCCSTSECRLSGVLRT
jgi:hypothetical protein